MSEAAALLTARVPNLDSDLASYLESYISDEASAQTLAIDGPEELDSLLQPALEEHGLNSTDSNELVEKIKAIMLHSVGGSRDGYGKAKALDHVVNLNFSAAQNTLMPGNVDISSTSKGRNTQGQCCIHFLLITTLNTASQSIWPSWRKPKPNCIFCFSLTVEHLSYRHHRADALKQINEQPRQA